MTTALESLYAAHLACVRQHADAALARAGREHLVIAAGRAPMQFLDDMPYPFKVNPHFKWWLPVTQAPGCWLVHTPGQKPRLIYLQPHDYWHVVPAVPSGYWVDSFDIHIIRDAADARALLPADPSRCAVLGEPSAALGDMRPDNPAAVLDYLHWQRAYKSPYEIELMREASRIGCRAHRAAQAAFHGGESEFGIHVAYLKAAGLMEEELPYGNIVALNAHAAVLHYMVPSRASVPQRDSFLIDAGAQCHGYASDITRTCAGPGADAFQALIDSMEQAQQSFCAMVQAGQSYPALHLHAHHVIAGILKQHGFIDMGAEEAVASGLSSHFFPHGLGHLIGLQVHDIGGFMAGPDGGSVARPEGHPYLRLTRTLEPGMVVTIEPGLYFIDLLLDELKATPQAKAVNWSKVDAFRRYGGIRIEDDVVCTDAAPLNLTREAFAAA
ncbi:MAG TPA: Xaa-Pro dipeptidase [Rhodanobacteraceae bacterium]|nr:Xaa-Pro dipeptidase [Rhodanobacteraceae bacterium]